MVAVVVVDDRRCGVPITTPGPPLAVIASRADAKPACTEASFTAAAKVWLNTVPPLSRPSTCVEKALSCTVETVAGLKTSISVVLVVVVMTPSCAIAGVAETATASTATSAGPINAGR